MISMLRDRKTPKIYLALNLSLSYTYQKSGK